MRHHKNICTGYSFGTVAFALLVSTACSGPKSTLPPGFETLHLEMSVAELKSQRPNVKPDGTDRYYDAVSQAAFTIQNDKVTGVRFFVRTPADKLILSYYAKHFARSRIDDFSYNIEGKALKLFQAENGLEVIYGQDPQTALKSLAEEAKKLARKSASKSDERLFRARGSVLLRPKSYPVARNANGIDIWLHPIGEPLNLPVSMEIVFGTGSSDETDSNRGSTAVVGALAVLEILPLSRKHNVRVEQLTLRTAMVIRFEGLAEDVTVVSENFAKELVARASVKSNSEQIEGAFSSALRQSMGTTLNPRLLADEGLGAIFASSSYSPSPVSRNYQAPDDAKIRARAQQINQAPVRILVAGAIGPRYAYALAETLGNRKPDTRRALPRPSLPNRESRKVANPALAIDGLWIDTSSITQIANLYVARSILAQEARRKLRFEHSIAEEPILTTAGGQNIASYLMAISKAQGEDAQAIGLASRTIFSRLPQSVPEGDAFVTIKEGAVAQLQRHWSTPSSAVKLMFELAMLGVKLEALPAISKKMQTLSEHETRAFLVKSAIPENTFSVRWGPEQ